MDDFTIKQRSVFQPTNFRNPINIIGTGGMGSMIAESFVRMGLGMRENPIFLWDNDSFELHNLANQQVMHSQIGSHKVESVRENMLRINPDALIHTRKSRVLKGIPMFGVVIVCIDSMDGRGTIMEHCLEGRKNVACVIETRMDARTGISHCFDPNNTRHCDCWWEQHYTDKETDNMTGCSGHVSIISAIHGTTMLALKQLEMFARIGKPHHMPNRLYQDFDQPRIKAVEWPTSPHWD